MEAGRTRTDLPDRHVYGKGFVEEALQVPWGRSALGWEMEVGHLAEGMDTGIRASGSREYDHSQPSFV
jgi:hypothetical protein